MRRSVLLVNPPLWNAYAPHLAVPLLVAVMKRASWPTRGYDLGIECIDFLLSCAGQKALAERLEERFADRPDDARVARAVMLSPLVVAAIDDAKAALRSVEGMADDAAYARALVVLRNAMWCVSAAFDGLTFDLTANDLYYSARSTADVLAAVDDADRNVYRWVMERLPLPADLEDADLGLVGLSVSSDTQLVAAMTFARIVKQRRPDLHIVMGGNFTTRMVTRWKSRSDLFDLVDSFVLYEGEAALPRLSEHLFEGGPIESVPGLVWYDSDTRQLRTNDSFDVDINDSPCPDYSDYPLDKYFAPGPILPIFGSRSCAWSCAFCAIPFASNRFRMRSGSAVADEMDELSARHGTSYFYLVDEIITLPSFRQVSQALIERDRDYRWYGETRFFAGLDDELAQTIHDGGCRRLSLGMESYNQRVLDLMSKGTKMSWIDSNLSALMKAGVPVHLFCITGFPGETAREAEATLEFVTGFCAHAEERYGVKHVTWGAAPFVLDLHSPVGRNPLEFGVVIVNPSEREDLALTANYRPVAGLTQDEAWRIVGAVQHDRFNRQATTTFWFERPVQHYVEERLFLRTCLGLGEEPSTEFPVAAWERARGGLLSFSADVSAQPIATDDGPASRIYCQASDTVITVAHSTSDIVSDLSAPSSLEDKVDVLVKAGMARGSAEELVFALRRLRFFGEIPSITPTEDTLYWQELDVQAEFDIDRGAGLLTRESTGTTISVGPAAFGFFLLARDGVAATDGRLRDLITTSSGVHRQTLVESLVKHGFIYAAS